MIVLRAQSRIALRQRLAPAPSLQKAAISSSSSSSLRSTFARLNPAYRPSINPSILPQAPTSVRAMSTHFGESAVRPEPDQVVQDIADYVHNYNIESDLAWETARLCLIDTIGCGLEGLRFEECRRLLGPVVEGTVVPNGELISNSLSPQSLITPRSRYQGPRHQLPT